MRLLGGALVIALACIACKRKEAARAPAGPKAAWQAPIDKDTFEAIATADGAFVAVGKSGVVALRDGERAWTRALEAEPSAWVLPLGTDAILAGDDAGAVYAIALADGSVRWKAKTPVPDGTTDTPSVTDAATAAGRIVLLDAYERFLVLDAAACATGGATCMTPSGQLASGASGERLVLAPDGMRVVSGFSWIALFSPAGERITSFIADDLIGGIAFTSQGVVVTHDKGVARLHPERCKIEGSKFRLGTREDRDEAPAECIDRIHGNATAAYAPVASARGVAWVTDDDELAGIGAKPWSIPMATLHLASQAVVDGELAYVACWVEPTGNEMFVSIADLCAVSLDTGRIAWRSPLGLRRAGMLSSPWITVGGGMIYVVLADQVAAVRRPS